jgi:putative endonuclease
VRRGHPRPVSAADRRRRHRSGHLSEFAAALFLAAKGYRILARRWTSPAGEIDLIAVRGKRLAFIEVKRRATLADAEAAILSLQRRRVRAAADLWLARHPRYQGHDIGFDLILLVSRRWPRHLANAL